MKDSELFTFIKDYNNWNVIKNRGHELNYHIHVDGSTVILFFQESDGKKDWRDNLNFLPIFCKVYKKQENHMICHRGFIKEYKSGNDTIMTELINVVGTIPNPKVMISGWSNGAAMATLAAEDFYYRFSSKPEVVTFGNPKVCFDKKTAKRVKQCCTDFREYCNNNDIVTKLPPIGRHVNKIKCGDSFSIFKIFDPWKYHTNYDKDLEK